MEWPLSDALEVQHGKRPCAQCKDRRNVTKATAARHPRTTMVVSGANKRSAKAYRSASTGRYVTKGTAKRKPDGTVIENV